MAGRNFSGDSTDDILVRNMSNGDIRVWIMSGGMRTQVVSVPDPIPLGLDYSLHVGVDESPSDSVADLFWFYVEPAPFFGENNGTAQIRDGNQTVWWQTTDPQSSLAWGFGAIGNFDGDVYSEFILRDPSGHFIYVDDKAARSEVVTFENTASMEAGYKFLFRNPDLSVRGTGDFNGDGKADLVFQDPAGTVFFADVDDGTFDGWGLVTGLGPDWRIDAIGDINNDGIADIIVRNTVSHDIFYGRVANGGGIAQWFDLGDLTAAYAVRGLADVTGDGVLDLLVQRSFGAFPDGKVWYADISTGSPVWTDLPNPFPWSSDWVII